MYYEIVENKQSSEWILFIHGLGGSIRTWKKQLEKFSEKFNLLLVDLDGHGNSDATKQKTKYKSEEAVKKIKDILNKENIKKVLQIVCEKFVVLSQKLLYDYYYAVAIWIKG